MLLGLSMFLSGLITYLLFKGLQYYYHTNVQYGEPLAQFRLVIARFGDFTLFFIIFILLSFLFSFSLLSHILLILKKFQTGFTSLPEEILTTRYISVQMMNLGTLHVILIWQVKNYKKQFKEEIFQKAVRINWS